MEEPAIMQVILELSEFINSLEAWVSCLEDDRPYEGKRDYDAKELLSLITLVNPESEQPLPSNPEPKLDLDAPDIKRDPEPQGFPPQPTSPQILTPKDDLTAEFDVFPVPRIDILSSRAVVVTWNK